jgi:hypothetical protein
MPGKLDRVRLPGDAGAMLASYAATGDDTPRHMLTDYLEERGLHHYAMVVRHHVEPDQYGYLKHPSDEGDHVTYPFHFGTPSFGTQHPMRLMLGYAKDGFRPLPVVQLAMRLPGSKRHVVFHAPFTDEQMRQFMAAFPRGATKNRWLHTVEHGLKLKLARGRNAPVKKLPELMRHPQFWRFLLVKRNPHLLDLAASALEAAGLPLHGYAVRNHRADIPPSGYTGHFGSPSLHPDMDKTSHATSPYLRFDYGDGQHEGGLGAGKRFGGDLLQLGSIHRYRHDNAPKAPVGAQHSLSESHPAIRWTLGDYTTQFFAPVPREHLRGLLAAMPNGKEREELTKYVGHKGWYVTGGKGKKDAKLARPQPVSSEPSARADMGDERQGKRRKIAMQILTEAGLTPAAVRNVLAHSGDKGVRAAVLQLIRKHVHPARTRYAAAWYGLLSGEKRLTVFHPHPNGEDFLHVITSPVASDTMANYLRGSGHAVFSIEDRPGGGSRAFIFNPLGKLNLDTVSEGLRASHSKLPGYGYRIGSGEGADADARAAYRSVIRDYESAAGPAEDAADPPAAGVHSPGVV